MRTIGKIAVGCFGSLLLATQAQAQEGLAGVGAASAMGATLGAAAAGGISAGGATRNVGRTQNELMDEGGNGGAPGRMGPGGTTTTTTTTTVVQNEPLNWGTGNGRQIIGQLLAPRPKVTKPKRSPAAQSRYSRSVSRLTPRQRTKLVMSKYKIPPRGWLAHYLPQDRYKITSGIWKVVSTETDRFYYRADAPAMLRQSPNRVIGFASWQDAMIAGYRPDPITQPEPGAQLAYMARITRGPQLTRFVEYAYAGQMTPTNFEATYRYVRQVVRTVNQYPYVRQLLPETIETILQASLESNPALIPTSIGGTPIVTTVAPAAVPGGEPGSTSGVPTMPNGSPQPDGAALAEKREEEFNAFRNRAGGMANVPANR
jgi:hypothetical protein